MLQLKRRDFLKSGAAFATTIGLPISLTAESKIASVPVTISSANGLAATTKAMDMIKGGSDLLDAVITAVNLVEDDPNDITVGYGGLPNEQGEVELDASVMHGPTGRGGAVASLRNIKNPSKVARLVMERTDHVLLVGEGALQFARAHGFSEENLLTDRSRKIWLEWKEKLSNSDDWLPPHTVDTKDIGAIISEWKRTMGTIHLSGVDAKGDLSAVTTTSGLAFKIPGRVGDSPILGAGIYVDNEVGAAGSTGRGEANLLSCASFFIVEEMARGVNPEQACLNACKRVMRQTKMRRLLGDNGKPKFNVNYYALKKNGEYGSASIYEGSQYAVNTGSESKLKDAAFLFKISEKP